MKKLIQSFLHRYGWELRKYDIENREWLRLQRMLSSNRVSVIFDIGASLGNFARPLIDAGFMGRVVSFEPLQHSFAHLSSVASMYPNWAVENMALGRTNGSVQMNVSGNVGSSSIMRMNSEHLEIFPVSQTIRCEEVKVSTLDQMADKYLISDDLPFLKLDVQGFEMEVLAGAEKTLRRSVGIEIELSFVELYDRQPLFDETAQYIKSRGFEPWAFFPATTDPSTGRMLQVDGIFFRDQPT